MNWNLNCRKTRRLLALSAGNDVEERDLAGAQRHLAVCPQCREVWQALRQSQQVLEQVRAAPAEGKGSPTPGWPAPSLWPTVARHVRAIDAQGAAPDWRGWLPAGALAAACVAVVMVALPDLSPGPATARRRDARRTVAPQFFISSDSETLNRQPVMIYRDRETDQDRLPQLLRPRDEPRSF
ncbi:MAG: hypothetical protein ACM3U2_22265 [Deltaproteobacteria bacterium]